MDMTSSDRLQDRELLDREVDEIIRDIMTSVEEPVEETPAPVETPKQEQNQEQKPEKKEKPGWQAGMLSYLHDLVYLLAGLILVFLLLFRVVVVSGTSMNNTLLNGDYLLLLSNTFYHNPQYGDIVVASKDTYDNGAPIVKRVIATEGQVVDIDFDRGIVYVGDSPDTLQPLDEPYTMTPTNIQEGVQFPVTVEEGCLFVMGDNRNGSLDSRDESIGLVDKREVIGKVFFLFIPGSNSEADPRPVDWSRFGWIGGIS